jgi:tRNA (guanine-N7-)-methyltransferase
MKQTEDSELLDEPVESGGVPAEIIAAQVQRVAALRAELNDFLPVDKPLVLELGCGHGHWLTSYAEAFPGQACLGVDLISARIRKALQKRDRLGLDHLTFIKAEATELLRAWPADRRLESVFMLFPDPWPKKRHFKNRMIQPAFLAKLATLVEPQGHFHFRTDHADYFEWTREHLAEHPDWELVEDLKWPWEAPSYFQNMMDSWQSLIAKPVA